MFVIVIICPLFLVLGYLIRFKKKLNLINGYRKGKVKDEDRYASFFGNYMFILSGITFLFGLSLEKFWTIGTILYVAFVILSAIYVSYKSWNM